MVDLRGDMESGMNQDAPVTRLEFDRAIRALHAEFRAVRSAPAVGAGTGPGTSPDDFVRRDEFRLFKWFTGLALAAVLGGFGVLYQAITDVQRGLVEVHQSLAEVLRSLGDIRERLVRVETVLELDGRAGPDDASPGAD